MSEPGKPPDISNLSENLSQQQAKITALKELVRQSESQAGRNTASAQEKVKNIAQRLSNLKAKSAKNRHQRTSSEVSDYEFSNIEEEDQAAGHSRDAPEPASIRWTKSETPGSEKITILRKQMELNRVKMAERESKSKEIEQMVTQLKSKFETSQMSLEKSFELGRSVGDLSLNASTGSIFHPQLRSSTFADVSQSRAAANFDTERIRFLEQRVHELESANLGVNECFSESDKIHSLERKILDLEENLREKESIIDARTKAVSLLSENLTKKKKDVVDSLEETKVEMFRMQEVFLDAESSYKVEVERLNRIIKEKSEANENLNEKIDILEKSRYELTIENSDLKTKLEDVKDYSTKLTELNKINETLQKQIANLESQKYEFVSEEDVGGEEKKDASSDELVEKIERLEAELLKKSDVIEELDEKLQEKTVELNVVNANLTVLQEKLSSKSLTRSAFNIEEEESNAESAKFKQQLDEANKAAIKDKLKIKQLQKQVDSFKKGNADKEVTRLNEEIQNLNQKIAELEESSKAEGWDSWGGGEEAAAELEKKIQMLEATCQNQTEAINLLEQQKLELTEDLQSAKNSENVNELEEKVRQLTEAKRAVDEKLSRYVSQNTELLDKIEEISKGSSASAESIEMVTLTAQETEEYRKTLEGEPQPEISEELNESLKSLREESSELMSKIELFTIERREVLDKLDAVTIENQVLVSSIETLRAERVDLEHANECLSEKVGENEKLISALQQEKEELSTKVVDLSDHRSKLQDEINKLVKESIDATSSSPQASPSKSAAEPAAPVTSSIDKEACDKLLKQLENDIQSLHKNKDKNQKLKISKKLSDNAKNVHAMMTNLLVDYYKTLEECQQLRCDLETVKSHVDSVMMSSNNDNEVKELKEKLEEKTKQFDELKNKLDQLDEDTTKDEMDVLKSKLESLTAALTEKDVTTAKLQEMIDNLTMERDRFEIEVRNQKESAAELRSDFDNLYADVRVNNQKLQEKSIELDKLQREFDMRLKTSTSEVEILKTLVAEQKQLLIDAYQEHELDINQKVQEIDNYKIQVDEMTKELENLRKQNNENRENYSSDLNVEIEKLREILRDNEKTLEEHKDELVHKQETIDTLNSQIIDLYKTMEENANKIIEKEDEIQYLQEINDTIRDEIRKLHQKLDESAKTAAELQSQLDSERSTPRAPEVVTSNPAHDEKIKQLEDEVRKLEAKNKESVDKLKKFAANLKKKQAQVTELESKLAKSAPIQRDVPDAAATINDLRSQLSSYAEKLQVEESKCDEMEKNLFDFDMKMHEMEAERRQLIESKSQLELNLHAYETRIQELEEPVNKLKEMSNAFEKLRKENEELKEKMSKGGSQEGEKSEERKKMEKLKATAVQLKHKLTDKKKEVDDLTEQLEKLKSSQISSEETDNLRSQLSSLQSEHEKKIEEMQQSHDHAMQELRSQIDNSNSTINEDKQRKLSLEAQLETFELTTMQLRDRLSYLEETIAKMETDQSSLQREKLSLAAELEEKDEAMNKQFREMQDDSVRLSETIRELATERNELLQKLAQVETELTATSLNTTNHIADIESQNESLQKQVAQLQAEIKKAQASHEQAIATKHAEIDEMESELSAQLQKIDSEKKTIQEALEKANDQIVDFQDEVVRLKDTIHSLEQSRADIEREFSWLKLQSENYTQDQLEIEQLRMQLMQSETEIENLRTQNENLQENHNVEITILRQQIADLETMRSQVSQNQTDDQVMLQNENIRLKELLAEKENEIAQRANVAQPQPTQQLASSLFDSLPVQAVNDPFSNLATAPSPSHSQPPTAAVDHHQHEIEQLRESLSVANLELDMQSSRVEELLAENERLSEKLHELQSISDNLIKNNVELDASVETKQREIDEIKSELKNLRENLNRSTDDEKTHVLETEFESIQGIVSRFDGANVAPSTSMFFSDGPAAASLFDEPANPAAASLFDEAFIPEPPQPVVEEMIVPRRAYLCQDQLCESETQTDNSWIASLENELQELHQQIAGFQSELQQQSAIIENQNFNMQQYCARISELEGALEASVSQQEVAIQPVEAVVEQVSIQNYFSAPQGQLNALEIEDDGWGWGSSEAAAQEAAAAAIPPTSSLLSPRSETEVRLQEQRDIVDRLEREKAALNEELAASKENSKKMMKKLKEYQTKIKELETKSQRKSSSFDADMDLVIQEELNSQIQKLEAKLKEMSGERTKECDEREALVKKIDVLTAANERMVEMKERQDGQMELYQLKVRELNQKLANLESWGEGDGQQRSAGEQPKNVDVGSSANESEKIAELTAHIKDLQVDLDEVQALLEEEKANNKRLEEKLSVASNSSELQQLTEQIEDITADRDRLAKMLSRKDEQISELIEKIDMLSNDSSNIRTILEDLSSQNQQKTNENQELSSRLQNLAKQNEELSKERQFVNDSMESSFRHHTDELEQQIQQLNAELVYKTSQIEELRQKIADLTSESDQARSLVDDVAAKDNELAALKARITELEQQQQQPAAPAPTSDENSNKTISDLLAEKANMEHELQVLNDQVIASLEFEDRMKSTVLELDAKNIEIQALKVTLERMQTDETRVAELERNIDLINAQWSQAVEQRGNEVATSWKQHVEMREAEFAAQLRQLEQPTKSSSEQATSSSEPKSESSSSIDNEDLQKMQTIMESQEVEIVSLKEQLAIRSAEYASLAARIDPYRQMNLNQPQFAQQSSDSDRVPRSELDLALYMLHQRDMRLEEMTMELVRLLEERDQLQLRLSDSLRQSEDIRRKFNVQEAESSDNSKNVTPEKSPSAGEENLRAKLTELNTIRHMRDKVIQDERERRFIDNMSMMQRDVENLPDEAAARIVGSSDNKSQSPSSVLMNWIMGNKPDSN